MTVLIRMERLIQRITGPDEMYNLSSMFQVYPRSSSLRTCPENPSQLAHRGAAAFLWTLCPTLKGEPSHPERETSSGGWGSTIPFFWSLPNVHDHRRALECRSMGRGKDLLSDLFPSSTMIRYNTSNTAECGPNLAVAGQQRPELFLVGIESQRGVKTVVFSRREVWPQSLRCWLSSGPLHIQSQSIQRVTVWWCQVNHLLQAEKQFP